MIRAAIIGATPGEIAAALASLCAVITALWAVYRTKDNKHDKSQEDAIASLRKDLKAVSDARDAAWREVVAGRDRVIQDHRELLERLLNTQTHVTTVLDGVTRTNENTKLAIKEVQDELEDIRLVITACRAHLNLPGGSDG